MMTERDYMCLSKRRFESRAQAQAEATLRGRLVSLRAYRCPYCQMFHITKKAFQPGRWPVRVGRSR